MSLKMQKKKTRQNVPALDVRTLAACIASKCRSSVTGSRRPAKVASVPASDTPNINFGWESCDVFERAVQLVGHLAALMDYCNGRLDKNVYVIHEYRAALALLAEITGTRDPFLVSVKTLRKLVEK